MTDTLGWRRVFGVVTPSTNTVVQPEYDAMRPTGVTNHVEGMYIPDDPIESDADQDELIRRIDSALEDAIDRVLTCRPDHVILGISAESVWGEAERSRTIADRVRAKAGNLPFTQASDALPAALTVLGVRRRIAVLTPYMSVAQAHIDRYFSAAGYEVIASRHLECGSPVLIGHTTSETLISALGDLARTDVDAIVQFGANLPMARLAAEAERWLGKPVVAVNVATYWHALRTGGILDRVDGFGRLMSEF